MLPGMRLLVLGGSWFLGRWLCECALGRGWQVTTFRRGLSGKDPAGVDPVRGDRTSSEDLTRLTRHGPWDAVVDTSGMVPEMVRLALTHLEPVIGRYVYVSTVNAYRDWPSEPLDDESELREPLDEWPDGVTATEAYGGVKAGCERAVADGIEAGRSLVVRPGVLLGPYEYVGRLPWLLRRMTAGGPVLAAGDPARSIQPLDVRDLATFVLDCIANDVSGAMNTTAPIGHATYGELLAASREATGSDAELVWVDDDWLADQSVTPWTEIPLWRTAAGVWAVSSARAQGLGLTSRPLADTVRDTWASLQTEPLMPHSRQGEIGLDPVKERALLGAWTSRRLDETC